jgi:hypothetical protein
MLSTFRPVAPIPIVAPGVNRVIYYHRRQLPNSAVVGLAAAYADERVVVGVGEQFANELLNGEQNAA